MDAEALIETTLGTCTLQKLIGQGGMGAVYLAQQSRPRRQVAVKVLLPMTSLTPHQHAAFLERFRRETDAAASLEHPNIMPVHEYGEGDGLAYLVMPYVSGGTLRDEMEREGPLPLIMVVNYLEQMAAALGQAHERGVIHRDIKPANILMTQEKRLLLTDFGLVKVVGEGQAPLARLTGVGVPMGTPDYMAPEQVIGGHIDARADLYSLGVILYQMITGSVPFKGDMPMQVAIQHLQVPPPPLRSMRPDLPVAAEQVVMCALSKNPLDRYRRAQDFASAFHLALTAEGIQLGDTSNTAAMRGVRPETRNFAPRSRGLFDPIWQTNAGIIPTSQQRAEVPESAAPVASNAEATQQKPTLARNDLIAKTSMTLPSFTGLLPPSNLEQQLSFPSAPVPSPGLQGAGNTPPPIEPVVPMRKAGLLRSFEPTGALAQSPTHESGESATLSTTNMLIQNQQAPVQPDPAAPNVTKVLEPLGASAVETANAPGGYSGQGTTGALTLTNYPGQGTTAMMKLTQPMKVVKVPVAGKPGQYVTGLLPVISQPLELASPASEEPPKARRRKSHKKLFLIALLAAVVLILLGSGGTYWLLHLRASQPKETLAPVTTPDIGATATALVSATAQANTLVDPLTENVHNWPVNNTGKQQFIFKSDGYHIINNDNDKNAANALLPDKVLTGSFEYMLTCFEVKGDDKSIDNQFGMVIRYTAQQKDGKNSVTFYLFNVSTGEKSYQFWRYDDSFGSKVIPWTKLWSKPFDKEFKTGHGPEKKNTFKVIADKEKFTFEVNGKKVGSTQDKTLTSGQIGMLVNLKGTEIVFSDLKLMYK